MLIGENMEEKTPKRKIRLWIKVVVVLILLVLYTMLILMILLMFLILAILDNGRTTANKLSSEVKEEIDNKVYNKPIEVVSNSLYEKVVNEGEFKK